jgi:hypothetical protein
MGVFWDVVPCNLEVYPEDSHRQHSVSCSGSPELFSLPTDRLKEISEILHYLTQYLLQNTAV